MIKHRETAGEWKNDTLYPKSAITEVYCTNMRKTKYTKCVEKQKQNEKNTFHYDMIHNSYSAMNILG
jgi:hypothetical protein